MRARKNAAANHATNLATAPLYEVKAELFKALGHPARVRALEVLTEGARSVGDLQPDVGIELSQGAAPLHEARLGDAVCLAFGHEDRGLSGPVLAACDEVAFIPQLGRVASLNVAHAAAIAIYEARRRFWSR